MQIDLQATTGYPLFAVEDSPFSVYLRLLCLSMYSKAENTAKSSVKISGVFIESPFRFRKGQPGNYPNTVYTD